jgi:nitrite reductase/ring-hydroxylating ferredoxin subunit
MTEKRFEVCPASELQPGERRIETLGGFSVGVFNVDGEYHAMKNDCPHQRAPLCEGKLTGTNTSDTPGEYNWERDGQIVTCPWHGWEFDVTTGESVFNPHNVKAKTFEATIEAPEASAVDAGEDIATGGGAITSGDTAASRGAVAGGTADSETTTDGDCESCGVNLAGEKPPVETYDVEIEGDIVVVYL